MITPLKSLRFALKASLLATVALSAPTSAIALAEDAGRVKVTLGSEGGDTESSLLQKAQKAKREDDPTVDNKNKVATTATPDPKEEDVAPAPVEVKPAAPDPIEGLLQVPEMLDPPEDCERELLTAGDLENAVEADLKSMPKAEAAGMRYLSFVNLYNSCVEDEDIANFKNASIKLLNSLTWKTKLIAPEPVGPHELLLRFNMKDLGWTDRTWGQVLVSYPYAVRVNDKTYKSNWNLSRSIMPYIRADWLAFTASRTPLYYTLLAMPKSLNALKKKLGVDLARKRIQRTGFQLYGRKNASRMLERHARENGFFWQTFEFPSLEGKYDLMQFPLGPGGKGKFSSIGGTAQFSLPNGFKAWYIHNQGGRRINGVPIRDLGQKDWRASNGFYCPACNFSDLQLVPDRIRLHVDGNENFTPEVQDIIRKTHPRHDYMNFLFGHDMARYTAALKAAGLDPEETGGDGKELIQSFADHYQEEVVDLQMAAGEVGVPIEEFEQKLAAESSKAFNTVRTLAQRGISRIAFESKYPVIAKVTSGVSPIRGRTIGRRIGYQSSVARPKAGLEHRTGAFQLSLVSDKSRYKVGDTATFAVQTDRNCTLTLITPNRDGSGTIVFPNKFRASPTLSSKRELQFPGGYAPFEFRLNDPGEETLIALCDGTNRGSGIRHKFQEAPFTKIENVRKLLESWLDPKSKKRKRSLAHTVLRLPVEP